MKEPVNNTGNTGRANDYVLGHSDRELGRLMTQARIIDPITLRFFSKAGLTPGMRVLDVGCGAGDVAFLAAKLVGETGEVVGVDRVPAAVAAATERAAALSLSNVSFRVGDPAEMEFDQPFDAVIGRYVLQFQADPATMIRKLTAHVRSGGLVAFHEISWGGFWSHPPVPTYDRCCQWAINTLRLHGTETQMGVKLNETFVKADLPPPTMCLEALIGSGTISAGELFLTVELVATLLPEMERLGVATATEVGLESLSERIQNEAIASSSVILGRYQVGAWSRVK